MNREPTIIDFWGLTFTTLTVCPECGMCLNDVTRKVTTAESIMFSCECGWVGKEKYQVVVRLEKCK